MLPWLERQFLYGTALAVLIASMLCARQRLRHALPRIRWLMLAVGGVYAWTTPGEYLWVGLLSPTQEGLILGLHQVLRLFSVIASLQILIHFLSKADLFSALYVFAKPLELLGFSRKDLALRLTLTLEMMEVWMQRKRNISHLLQALKQPHFILHDKAHENTIVISIRPLSLRQLALLVVQIVLIIIGVLIWNTGFMQ